MSAKDLIGLGMSGEMAFMVNGNPVAVTAAGTSQATGKVLAAKSTGVSVTAAGGADSVVLPAAAPLFTPYVIDNPSGTTCNVFANSGASINSGSVNGNVTIVTLTGRLFIRTSATRWFSCASA